MPIHHFKTVQATAEALQDGTVRTELGAAPCVLIPLFRPASEVGQYIADPNTFRLLNHDLGEEATLILPPENVTTDRYADLVETVVGHIAGMAKVELDDSALLVLINEPSETRVFSIHGLSESDPYELRRLLRDIKQCLRSQRLLKCIETLCESQRHREFLDHDQRLLRLVSTLIQEERRLPTELGEMQHPGGAAAEPQAGLVEPTKPISGLAGSPVFVNKGTVKLVQSENKLRALEEKRHDKTVNLWFNSLSGEVASRGRDVTTIKGPLIRRLLVYLAYRNTQWCNYADLGKNVWHIPERYSRTMFKGCDRLRISLRCCGLPEEWLENQKGFWRLNVPGEVVVIAKPTDLP